MTDALQRALRAARQDVRALPDPVVRLLAESVDALLARLERQLRSGRALDQQRISRLLAQLARALDELEAAATDAALRQALAAAERAVRTLLAQLDPAYRALGIPAPADAWRRATQAAAAVAAGELADLFRHVNRTTAREAQRTLLTGLAAGLHPEAVGRELARVLDVALWRATTIARTELLRAYRAATLAGYREAQPIVRGWRWLARLDRRTCPVCIALHGQTFPLEQPMGAHPNCRCTLVPVLVPPFDQLLPDIGTGEDWLRAQPAAVQERVLGPTRAALWRDGALPLAAFVRWRRHPVWGDEPVLVPLRDLAVRRAA